MTPTQTFDLLPGRPVNRVGYGTMQLMREDTPEFRRAGAEVLRRAVELGANHLDTAHFYGRGAVIELIREALHPYPEDLAIVSKVGLGPNRETGAFEVAQHPRQIREQVEHTLKVLDRDHLEGVNMRRMDTGRFQAPPEQRFPLEDQLAVLQELRDEGKVLGIGVSNVTAEQVRAALPVGLFGVQNAYNLLSRGDEDVLRLCGENGIAYVPYFPLGSGSPMFPKVTENDAVLAAADRLGATPSQVGLAWLLQHSPNVLLIPGTSSVAHLEENMGAAALDLPEDVVASLDAAGDTGHRLGT